MKMRNILLVAVLSIIGGVVAGVLARNIFVGVAFPILIVLFYIMYRTLNKTSKFTDAFKTPTEEQTTTNEQETPQEQLPN